MIALPIQTKKFAFSQELNRVSRRLNALQNMLFEKYGIDTIYIGAGSSLAVLDHVLQGKELVMRDLDTFACIEEEMTADKARTMGQYLESPEIGRFSQHDVRPRRRGNPNLPAPEAYDYNAGFGLFLVDDADTILDLTVFHSHSDLLLNGIMNVDRVRIRLEHGTSLVEQLAPLLTIEEVSLVTAGVEDEFAGYKSWTNSSAELVNEFDVKRAPLETILRIIRGFAKFARPNLTESTEFKLRRLMSLAEENNRSFYSIRGLIKILNDRNVVWELQVLRRIGGLKKLGGQGRQEIENLLRLIDRFENDTITIQDEIHEARVRLEKLEHEMKLEGVA